MTLYLTRQQIQSLKYATDENFQQLRDDIIDAIKQFDIPRAETMPKRVQNEAYRFLTALRNASRIQADTDERDRLLMMRGALFNFFLDNDIINKPKDYMREIEWTIDIPADLNLPFDFEKLQQRGGD